MQFRGTCLVTFAFLSLWWHSDRSLPVWHRGRESFRPPSSVAGAKRHAGHLPSAAGCRLRGLVPPNGGVHSVVGEKARPCLPPSPGSTGSKHHMRRGDPGCRPSRQGI